MQKEWSGGRDCEQACFLPAYIDSDGIRLLSCSGIDKVAYMRNIEISLSENDFQPVQDLELLVTRHGYYSSKMLNDTFFYHGGPDHLKSIAVQLTVDYILIYFGFVLFLFV